MQRTPSLWKEVFLAIGLFAALSGAGCGEGTTTRNAKESARGLDLTDRFYAPGAALKGAGSGTFDRHYDVVRKGRKMDSLLLIAPVKAVVDIKNLAGTYLLEGWFTQVFNTGDGIQMDIYQVAEGQRRNIYSRYVDAGRCGQDRDWIAFQVPLSLESGQSTRIEIAASGGPQGDLVADWLAVSSLRLIQK